MIEILLPSALLILLGISFYRLLSYSLPKSKSDLPIHRPSSSSSFSSGSVFTFTRQGFTLTASTTALHSLTRSIVPPRFGNGGGGGNRVIVSLRWMYDAGVIIGIIGGIAGIGITTWAMGEVWKAVWREAREHAAMKVDEVGRGVMKRAVSTAREGGAAGAQAAAASGGGLSALQPLIPGVTIPWSHLPTLVLAVVVNQLIHELGHVLSAAVDDVLPSKLTFNLHGVIPSMAIHFPSAVDSLPPRAKMRIAASGPLHNFITWRWLHLLILTGTSTLFWRDVDHTGKVVQSVRMASALEGHIAPGDLITHLDDTRIGRGDAWTTYLSGTEEIAANRGWCMDKVAFTNLPEIPCSPTSGEIVFQLSEPNNDTNATAFFRCLDPNPLLHVSTTACPCPGTKWLCVRPSSQERIMRVRIEDGTHEGRVVIWAGDRRVVLEDLTVGSEEPRFASDTIRWGSMFLEYMSTISLSLFLFNLLPLPNTDGSQLLQSLLSLHRPAVPRTISLRASIHPRTHALTRPMPSINIRGRSFSSNFDSERSGYDEDDGDGRMDEAWKRRVRRGVEGGVAVLGIGWVAGWLMLGLLRSS